MYFSCWKDIGSPPLNQSLNTLEAYDGRGCHPYGILTSFPITLEGNIVELEVEVVDENMNYNLLLGQSWIHAMFCVVFSSFQVLHFPHEEKIIMLINCPFSLPVPQKEMSHMWEISIFHMRVWVQAFSKILL